MILLHAASMTVSAIGDGKTSPIRPIDRLVLRSCASYARRENIEEHAGPYPRTIKVAPVAQREPSRTRQLVERSQPYESVDLKTLLPSIVRRGNKLDAA